MNTQLLASIIQGEAGELGPIGMMAVALSLSCRIWQHGHDEDRIAAEYYGRSSPGPVATLLAELVGVVPEKNSGGLHDVEMFPRGTGKEQ